MAGRHAAALARIAEVAERLAMKHAERALTCDDPREEAQATAAFQKAARVMRQSMALEAKLARDAEQGARETISRESRELTFQVHHRRTQISATAERLIRTETGSEPEAERLCDELDDLLDIEALTEGFTTEDLATQITRLCKALGLTGFEVLAVIPDPSAPVGEGGPSDPAIVGSEGRNLGGSLRTLNSS
jgi:N-methylhydantoinase A/oxoprolinase/acetone carboxylase beta subunit